MLPTFSSVPSYLTKPYLRARLAAPKASWGVSCLGYSVYAILTLVVFIIITASTVLPLAGIVIGAVLALPIGHLAHVLTSLKSNIAVV